MKRPKQRIITFTISAELDDAVERMARSSRMFKWAIIETAIQQYIEKTPVANQK